MANEFNIKNGFISKGDSIVSGRLDVTTTISATTYQNLPDNVTGRYLPLSGGTVTGETIFQSGLTANTISADTLTITNNIDSTFRYLYRNDSNVTVDWQNSQLQGSGPILDWGQGLIKDSGPTLSIDWLNRTLNDSGGNTVVDWTNLELLDASNVSLNWTSRLLSDTNGGGSVEWDNRKLYKSGGTISFDWENGILTGQTNIQSSTISATTYQNLPTLRMKSDSVAAGSFAGNPKKYTVTFTTSYPNTSYTISITGADNRAFTYESKATTGFVINTNANTALTGNVDWQTIAIGES